MSTTNQATDFRALCEELILSWDANGCDWRPQHQARWEATVARARAALAEEEVGPSGSALRPIPLSERLPGPEDCDAKGRCWTTEYHPPLVYPPEWKMTWLPDSELGHDFSNAYFWRSVRFWLPAHALPIPENADD